MSFRRLRASLAGLGVALVPLHQSEAHEIVGNRFFPATLTIDDPGVNDELSLPTVDNFNTGDVPPVRQRDISAEFSKRITEDFAISFGTTYTFLGPIDPTAAGANGFQNLETTFKYRVFKNPEHEFVMPGSRSRASWNSCTSLGYSLTEVPSEALMTSQPSVDLPVSKESTICSPDRREDSTRAASCAAGSPPVPRPPAGGEEEVAGTSAIPS